jgi:hypothetical protein
MGSSKSELSQGAKSSLKVIGRDVDLKTEFQLLFFLVEVRKVDFRSESLARRERQLNMSVLGWKGSLAVSVLVRLMYLMGLALRHRLYSFIFY